MLDVVPTRISWLVLNICRANARGKSENKRCGVFEQVFQSMNFPKTTHIVCLACASLSLSLSLGASYCLGTLAMYGTEHVVIRQHAGVACLYDLLLIN